MIMIFDYNQKLYTTTKQVGLRRWRRRDGQDRGEEEDEKDCGEGGRGEEDGDAEYQGEGDRTTARTAAAKRIKIRSTTSRTTAVRWTTRTAANGKTATRSTAARTGLQQG